MKFVPDRPFADPDIAARKLVEIASTIEPVQNGRIYIELVNAPFLKAWRQSRRIPGRHRPRARPRLAHAARERHLRALQRGRRGAVRLTVITSSS